MSAVAPSAAGMDGATTPVIEAVDLSVGYGRIPVIREMNLSVRPGEVVALVGPNGAGKTTTLNALGGYLRPLSGTVRWRGQDASGPPHRRAKDGLAFVNEARSVLRRLTTKQNLRLAGTDEDACLELFPELRPRLNIKAGDLSGGEQQMLAVGRALASSPVMMMADELSLGLSPKVTERLLIAVRAAADEDNVGVLLVEQHLNNALRFANRICLIISGRIEFDGRPAQLEENESSLVAAYLAGDTDALRRIAQGSQSG